MPPHELDQKMLGRLRELVETNFAGCDEPYAAVKSLDEEGRKQICRRLAEHLAGHAAESQQILAAGGAVQTPENLT